MEVGSNLFRIYKPSTSYFNTFENKYKVLSIHTNLKMMIYHFLFYYTTEIVLFLPFRKYRNI